MAGMPRRTRSPVLHTRPSLCPVRRGSKVRNPRGSVSDNLKSSGASWEIVEVTDSAAQVNLEDTPVESLWGSDASTPQSPSKRFGIGFNLPSLASLGITFGSTVSAGPVFSTTGVLSSSSTGPCFGATRIN